MTRVTPARRAALALLEQVERGRRLDVAWERRAEALSTGDRGWVHDAVFGTLRLRGRIDHVLDGVLHQGLESVAPPLLRVLRLGAYQILYMSGTPTYAAVSQSAGQATALGGRRATDLVNGVLRALARSGIDEAVFPSIETDPVGHLSTWGSHPRWLVERWVARFGVDRTRGIVDAGNLVPGLYLRPIGTEVDAAITTLAECGIRATQVPGTPSMVSLPAGTRPGDVLDAVPGIIQDPAAAGVCSHVRVARGERVSDLCAAPGGKAIALHDLGARVIALDRSFARALRMRRATRRLGLAVPVAVADATRPCVGDSDVVLVDAPCSGTGTFARGPDLKWKVTCDAVEQLALVQRRILEGAAAVVRKGGRLIYSTCTLEYEENREVVNSFLAENPAFEADGPRAEMQTLPGDLSSDGAYAMRMRRLA